MTKKMVIPWELKADFRLNGWTSIFKGFMYEIQEKYGAAEAIEMYERICKRDDRIKNLTNFFLTTFKIEGNDCETIAKWHDIWHELCDFEWTWPERSNTIARCKITKCPWKLVPKELNNHSFGFQNIVVKTINPKASFERPKGMCKGDPFCEYIWKIEE